MYLEDKMTSAGEETFMHDLEIDDELRKQYEDELLISGLFENQLKENVTEQDFKFKSGEQHDSKIEASLEKKDHQKNESVVVKIFHEYRFIAAASTIVVLVSLFFIFIKRNNHHDVETTDKTHTLKDSGKQNGSGNKNQEQVSVYDKSKDTIESSKLTNMYKDAIKNLAMDTNNSHTTQIVRNPSHDKMVAEKAYNDFYAPYMKNDNDPIEVSLFYNSYKSGDYANVISATDTDIELAGSDDRDKLLKRYLQLYKGLTFLAERKPVDAIQYFDSVLKSSSKKSNEYYQAQWYQALGYLKNSDLHHAIEKAKTISQSQSTYRIKAKELLQEIKGK